MDKKAIYEIKKMEKELDDFTVVTRDLAKEKGFDLIIQVTKTNEHGTAMSRGCGFASTEPRFVLMIVCGMLDYLAETIKNIIGLELQDVSKETTHGKH